jgi:hypothetical protein
MLESNFTSNKVHPALSMPTMGSAIANFGGVDST